MNSEQAALLAVVAVIAAAAVSIYLDNKQQSGSMTQSRRGRGLANLQVN